VDARVSSYWLFVPWALMCGVLAFVQFRRVAAQSTRNTGTSDVPTFVGGLRTRTMRASFGLAQMEFFDWGIRLEGRSRFVSSALPTWEAGYRDLTKAQLVSVPFGTRGVRLFADGLPDPVVFSTPAGALILDRLQAHGVPVDRSLTRLWRITDHPE
jgi:hypothetical protein